MSDIFIQKLHNLLDNNLIPYMEILPGKKNNIDATIKVYFPKILLNICKFFDNQFTLENKKNIFIKKDSQGYSFVEFSFWLDKRKKTIRLQSILQNTWGIANNY